jgi:hypothetical protein
MGWALTREKNELTNEKDEREGKPVARQLALMISKFIRAQRESGTMEGMDDERLQLLEDAEELDHTWGIYERRTRSQPLSLARGLNNHLGTGTTLGTT